MGAPLPYPQTWLAPPDGPALVVAPHPDDETIGCGGIIALHRKRGDAVHVVVVTDGDRGDPEGRYPGGADYVARRREECRRAAGVLDLGEPIFLGLRDRAIDEPALLARLGEVVERLRPAAVYHPAAAEMHVDHQVVGDATLRAVARSGAHLRAFAYEVWGPVIPTHVIDVSSVWSVKQEALACYESQLVYNDYRRATAGLNAYRAIFLPHADYVEAFAETTPRRARWRLPGAGLLRRGLRQ